ncbi:MAG TPA: VOC family protein [Burkholderiales bacterium]|jgi:catechol 2,3-dioxygenase-like lactoylglutathione lyase family enzyme|nr:VOC family protein [Burkholderiales bacterium]
MLKPLGLTHGHYECRSLGETLPVFTDLLAMQVVERANQHAVVQHPNTAWRLVVHEAGAAAPDKPHNNHYGVRVARADEVDAAHRHLVANKERYGLRRISPPRSQHYARSVYFVEPGGNTLEIEHYDAQAVAEGRAIARPHWAQALAERDFPGRGYVPQALTHGTLECDDKEASAAFYRDVLGLEIAGGGRLSVYIKHAATPWYIVVLPIPRRKKFLSPANRFTLTLASSDDVEHAQRELRTAKGVAELGSLAQRDGRASFLFADLNRNWWEVAG